MGHWRCPSCSICVSIAFTYSILPVNPNNTEHGAPSDDVRHVGDLGNYKTDGQGNAKNSITDKLIKLIGPDSVIGVS